MGNNKFKRIVIAVIVLSMVLIPFIRIRLVKASTVVNHWTFSDSSLHLSYDVTEYQDDTFVIKEYYYGSISRTITGHAYIDTLKGRRWAKSVVDANTQNYWNDVMSSYAEKQKIEGWAVAVTTLQLLVAPPKTVLEYIFDGVLTALNVAEAHVNSNFATDTNKTIYEMACASEAAWHLINNPDVIVPSINRPRI